MLAMLNDVEACELFRFIRTHRRDGVDNLVKDERAANRERIGNDRRNDLCHQEVRLAVEQAVRTVRIDRRRREEARRDGAPRAAEAMDAERIEGIIVAHFLFEHRHGEVADAAADEADQDSRHRLDKAGCRRDGDKARDAAGRCAEHRRLAAAHPLKEHPADRRGRCRALRSDEGICCEAVRAERRARIETEPAEPEKRRAEHRHRQIVRQHGRLAIALALANQHAEREARDTRENVDDEAASEVERAELREEAAAPDPMCHRVVDQDRPEQDEQRERAELHALGKRSRDERRRDDGEHALERDEREFRNRAALEHVEADIGKPEFLEAADEATHIRAERHRVAENHPLHRNHRHDEEALHDGREHILAADHAAVEEPEAGGHDEYQGRADEDPGRIARVNHKYQILSSHHTTYKCGNICSYLPCGKWLKYL